jgi:DNA-binding NarL/FixJ family response regulator
MTSGEVADDDSGQQGGEGVDLLTVVLVEDHPVVRDLLVGQLTEAGLAVVAATGTLAEGYQAVLDHHPDIAVLDNHLPDGRGTDLCRRVRLDCPDVQVVIYSGHLTWEEDEQARSAGAAAAVPKSFGSQELMTAIVNSVHRNPGRSGPP